ncbi:hypothetical protein BCR37DRAFT_380026 [Protomyces lactucae-debilis]|uniref:Uncharacterized protein n=1 Tax=Protomyces lactucae-debilis TaxID=2754530 RepID=A0A1Y2FDV1_PROLT|nr:uncharacterized protein BCR37DRAFT_380026 [Protomyces lactucae-debilis]ORY82092.1 hypothetical protein BCR37DRAFT_380026 [Protomyces lactucae-debilis]
MADLHPIYQVEGVARCSADGPTALIVASGQEVFVACGSGIRWADLSEQTFLELDTVGIDFTITGLLLNRLRSILVVYGDHKVVALYVPRASMLKKRGLLKHRLKCHVIGEHHHSNSPVADVKLHPLSATDNAVVVLTADGSLRLYDLDISMTEPELEVSIFKRPSRGYGDLDDSEAVSFAFGLGGDGWAGFAVFVLTASGDVYIILPFMPASCALTHGQAANFEQHAVIDAGTASAAGYRKLLAAMDHGTRLVSSIRFARPAKLLAPVVLGPCLQSPVPLEFASTEVTATSILFLPSQPVNVLAIASQGKIDVCLVGPLLPKSKSEVVLAVHESIHLSASAVLEPIDEMSFFARHENGLHKVELSWLDLLSEVYETSELLLEDILDQATSSSTITKLLDAEGSGSAGVAITERGLDQSLVVLNAKTAHSIALTSFSLDDLDLGLDSLDAVHPEASYNSLLKAQAYQQPSLSKGPKIAVPAALQSSEPLVSDVQTLRFLTKVAREVRTEIAALLSAALALHHRLQLQLQEQIRQREKLERLADAIHQLPKGPEESERHDAVKERQTALEARAASMLTKLRNANAPELSVAETRYFDELKRIETHLHGHAGLFKRLASAKQQCASVSAAYQRWEKAGSLRQSPANSPLKVTQIARLKGQLEGTEEILSRTRNKMERLMRLSESH